MKVAKIKWIVLVAALMLPFSSATPVHEWEREVHYRNITLHAPAVAQLENGSYYGVLTEVNVTMMNGTGNVFVVTSPLTQLDMQGSAKLAVEVAGMLTGKDTSKYDFLFQVKASSPIVGGPSAGATMCIAAICLLENMDVNSNVIMTGMINPDGSIGPVGGILEKGEAAGKAGMKYFLIPKGQGIEYKTVEERNGFFIFYRKVPVNVSQVLYEKYGLIVKEVEDVNDALSYFTNYTFSESKSSKPILTSEYYQTIMEPLADKVLEMANRSYKNASTAFKQASIPVGSWLYNPRAIVSNSLKDAEKALKDAETAYNNNFYYFSISKAFQSMINSRFVLYTCMYYNGTSYDTLYQEVRKKVEDSLRAAEAAEVEGLSSLQCVGAAQQRALDAVDYINRSGQRDLDQIYYLAYAMERSNTVYWWLNLSSNFNESYGVNETWVQGMADNYYEYAQSIYSYASILSEETGYSGKYVNKAKDLMEKAGEEKKEYPAASLFNSLESIANSNLAIEMVGIDNSGIYGKLNRTAQMASYSIQKARNLSIEPILAVSYAEFGRSFEQDDVVSAITYYKYAYMIANMLCLSKGYNVSKMQKSNVPYSTSNGNENGGTTPYTLLFSMAIISFIVGMGTGIAIKSRGEEDGKKEEDYGEYKEEESSENYDVKEITENQE